MFSRPALVTALCLAAGVWGNRVFPANPALAAILFLTFAAVLVVQACIMKHLNGMVVVWVVVAGGFALGSLTIPSATTREQELLRFEDNTPHLCYATCAEDPIDYADGFSCRAFIHAVREHGMTPMGNASVIVRFTVYPDDTVHPSVHSGDHLLLFGKLDAISGVRNPGEFNYAEYFRVQNIAARVAVHGAMNMECIGSSADSSLPGLAHTAIDDLRRNIAGKFDAYIGGDEGNFLKGLLLGERSDLPDDIQSAFVNTGTFHVLAVAGLHVGFVLLIFIGLFSPVTSRTAYWLLLCGALAGYAMLAGAAPSVERATLMAGLAATGIYFERKLDGLNIIGAAACILLLANPVQLFTAGFQLSFAAAFGLVVFFPRLWNLASRIPIARWTAFRWTAELLCASLAAQLGTFPLTALYFEKLSFAGVAANLIVVPAAGVAIGFAALIAAASPLAWFGYLLGDCARLFVHGILAVVQWFAALPYAYADIPPFSLIQSVLFYAVVAFLVCVADWKTFATRACIATVALAALAIMPFSLQPHVMEHKTLTIAVLDVGQGDGIVAQLPNGKIVVVDAGPATMRQERNLPVAAFLRRQGITHIDALILTHLHADHIGGAPELLREFTIDTIYHSGERTGGVIPHLLDSLTEAGRCVGVKRVYAGDFIYSDSAVRIYILYPDSSVVNYAGIPEGRNLNNGSVVVKMQYGETGIILSGDLERTGEQRLANQYGDFLGAQILKTGHHGSATSSSQAYLASVAPRVAIISVGENNFGHPSPEVLARLRADSIDVERTDTEGALIWRSDGAAWNRVDWR